MDGVLASLAAARYVQAASKYVWGTPEVPPDTLLAVIIGFALSYLVVLSMFSKGRLGMWAFAYFFLSSDKKARKPDDATPAISAPSCKRMKVVFIRHGQSEWNAVFNEGSKLTLPLRLLRALASEALMFFEQDSLFMDSPLDEVGVAQAWDLMTFLASQPTRTLENGAASKPVKELEVPEIISIIRGDAGESVVASSILRRAVSTGFIALSPRFLKTSQAKDKMQLVTALQEISRNVDTLSLTPEKTVPVIPCGEANLKHMGDLMSHFYRTRFDKRHNTGNKTLKQKAKERQDLFIKWMFEQGSHVDCVIVLGHSIWFREFFKSFLPKASRHVAKTNKMVNCGVVAFDFYKDSKNVHRIPQDSVKEIYGGFEDKGKKGKRKQA
uniref:Uncharacterized protein n=1 Tax=Zooxanthella nutricula TaxID=1333877 RepID=A0A7S2NZW3_9DINO